MAEWSEIPKEDTVIVINTLDKEYEQKAKQYCQEEGIEHYITESNGRPGKGKNSVFDLFLKSDNDYCVLIDGDDLLTPHGVWLYNQASKLYDPPDAIGLKNQLSLKILRKKLYQFEPFTVNYNYLLGLDYVEEFVSNGLPLSKAKRFSDYHIKYFKKQKLYSEGNEIHCRVVFFSREAAKHRFNESLKVGEDTLQMLKLKDECVKGNIFFVLNNERPSTYIYDERTEGILQKTSEKGKNYNWMGAYLKKLNEMERNKELHKNIKLNELKIKYPKNYIPEDYGLNTASRTIRN
jgi:hypothetical protein